MDNFLQSGSGVGIDIVDVKRFSLLEGGVHNSFLKKVFFDSEISYCFSYKDPETHLAGTFALKEATSKALGVMLYPFAEIEVRHDTGGAPEVWYKGQKMDVKVSISHTSSIAVAIAVA